MNQIVTLVNNVVTNKMKKKKSTRQDCIFFVCVKGKTGNSGLVSLRLQMRQSKAKHPFNASSVTLTQPDTLFAQREHILLIRKCPGPSEIGYYPVRFIYGILMITQNAHILPTRIQSISNYLKIKLYS